jgi:hypothetical protein
MSHQCLADAFAPAEARHKARVMAATWGHLAPKRNQTYRGHIIWALGCFGDDHLNPTVLECELSGLESSPWFYEALHDFLRTHSEKAGGLFRFDGMFRNYQFRGRIRALRAVPA